MRTRKGRFGGLFFIGISHDKSDLQTASTGRQAPHRKVRPAGRRDAERAIWPRLRPVFTPTPYPAKLVPMTYDQRYIDGTNITTKDRQIYISSVGLAVAPEVGDIVTDASAAEYHVVAADPTCYDGIVNVVYIVQARMV